MTFPHIKITQRPLQHERVNWRKMAAIQATTLQNEYRAQLRSFAALGASCVLAWHGDRVVGSMISIPAENMRAVVDMADKLGADLAACIVPTCIYVDAAYEGMGIAGKMEIEMYRAAAEQGRSTCVYYGFAHERITGWVKHHEGCVDTGIHDPSGWPVYLVAVG